MDVFATMYYTYCGVIEVRGRYLVYAARENVESGCRGDYLGMARLELVAVFALGL